MKLLPDNSNLATILNKGLDVHRHEEPEKDYRLVTQPGELDDFYLALVLVAQRQFLQFVPGGKRANLFTARLYIAEANKGILDRPDIYYTVLSTELCRVEAVGIGYETPAIINEQNIINYGVEYMARVYGLDLSTALPE